MIRSARILLIFLSVICSLKIFSQMPACPNGLVYMHTSPIKVYNPALPLSATNPSNTGISLGGTGLAVGPNIFAATPATTFYTTIGGFYAYWNGSAWVTTSISTSNGSAVNIGGGPGCMYNLVGGTGQVYVTNGSGPSTLLTTITGFSGGGPYDLVVDGCCNFYVLKTTSPQSMTMYSPGGVAQCTYNMTNMPSTSAGGGFAIVGNQVIVSNVGGLYVGNITGTTISFTNVSTNSYGAGDFASCPLPCGPLTATAANTSSSTPIGCGSGTANVFVTSTLSPLSFTWSGPGIISGVNSATANVNQCGVYTCTVTKAGCPPSTTVVTTTIVCTTSFTPGITMSNTLSCTNPTAILTATPGPANHTYTWTGPGPIGTPNAQSITASVGGVYTATVLNTVTGCKGTATINLPANFTPPSLTVTPTPTSVCLGSSVNLTASGATGYTWSPGATLNTNNGPNVIATPVANTTYSVRGSVGICTVMTTAVVSINPQPSGVLSFTNATCGFNNGQIIITNTSGAGQTVTGFSVNGVGVPTQTVTGLAAGNYTVTMVNNFGCIVNLTTTIINSPPITALATTTVAPKCGASNGSITIGAVTGGTPTYSYNINGGPFSTSPPVTNLGPGTYTIGVIDSKGCLFTKTVVLTNVPGPTSLNFTTTPSSCSGAAGSVTIGVVGGTAAYSYSINSVASASTATGLTPGVKSVTVRDANGCIITGTFNIGTLTGPNAATVQVTNATCGNPNGSATVTAVSGGVAPYQYSFNGGPFAATNNISGQAAGTYTVIIRDANTCTLSIIYTITNAGMPTSSVAATQSVVCFGGNTGSFTVSTSGGSPGYSYTINPGGGSNVTGIFSGLTAGTYTVTMKDAAGCIVTVVNTILQSPNLTLNLTPFAVSCNAGSNGSVTATAGGGTSPYQYSLNGGPFQASNSFTGLTAGVYSVTVRDNNNCTRTATTTITQPAPLAISFTTAPTTCVGSVGTATMNVSGGTPAYSYSVNGSSTPSVATGLGVGTYTGTVMDNNGCILTGVFSINQVPGPTSATVNTSPATCGNANGSATVTGVTGGLAPYQYSFNGGPFSLTNNTGGLSAGTHTVIVRDANNCTLTITYNVNNTGSPGSSISASVNVNCFGGNTGSFNVNTIGGIAPYSYTLNPTGTTNTTGVFTGLTAQNYNVTVKDAVGCVTTVTITITEPAQLTLTLTPAPVSCNAGSNGSITATAGGGTPGYQYSINGGPFGASSNFTALTAGTYTVTVRDGNNCTFNLTTTITQPTALTLSTAVTPNSCAGSVGTVTMTAGGGSPAYTFSVNGSAATNPQSGLASATHTALVMDNNGCTRTQTFTIGNITGPASATINTTNANCGNANGSATVTGVTGGLAPYQYSFNGGPFSTNNFVSGQLAGTHTVLVIDANTCTLQVTYNVGNTGSPVSTVGNINNVSCFNGANGSFTINTAGGTPGYSYTLTPTNATSGTGVFAGLAAGAYSALVKDAAGCLTTVTVNITQPTALSLSVSSLPASCNGGTNGTITAAGSGGTGPYQYNVNGGPFQVSGVFTGYGAAIYNVTLQDNLGCTLTQSVQVNQPAPITLTLSSVNANCTAANGTASVTVAGGTPFYNYSWTGGGGTSSQTSPLGTGVYSVTVTDANGCSRTGSVMINSTPGGTAVISAQTNVSCFGGNNGSLTAGFTGAMNAPISYSWSNGQNTQTATNLSIGTYSVILTDAFGCTSTVAGTITEPGPLDIIPSATAAICYGSSTGTVMVTYGGGGTPPLTYLWAPGGATTAVVANVPAGTYTVVVTDSKGCTASPTITVTQPTSVTITSSVTTANCNQSNGSATVSATGGTPAYSYTWSTSQTGPVLTGAAAGTYTVIVQDNNGCIFQSAATVPNSAGPVLALTSQTNVSCFGGNNAAATTSVTGGNPPYVYLWSNGQNTGTGTNLMAGIYTATVTDLNGCKSSVSVTITEPSSLTINVTGNNPLCFNATNGTANAGVLGGTPGYTYNWVPSGSTSQSPTGLGAGNHIVTVTDANGCVINGSVTLTNPAQMTAAITSTNVTCFGACNGMANGSAANTIGTVVYYWTGGPAPLTTQNITGLCPGNYTLLAADQNSCTAQALVTITEPALLTASITASGNASCAGYSDGFATVAPAGGTPGYTYSWSPIGGTGSTANNLPAGNYIATITDAQGCTASANVTITQPAPLIATVSSTNVTCFGANNGISNVTYSGGTGPYTFLWFPTLNNSSNVNTLPPGTHTIQVTDNLGCITTLTTNITEPPALNAVMSASNSNCNQANGNACVTASGGAGGYTYQWSSNPLFTNSCINSVVAGAYTVTVTDVNGCTVTAIANINDIAGPSISITATTAVSCFGGNNGSAVSNISGGTGTISVLWSYLAQTTPNVNNLPSGLHSITITDQAGCVASASVQITEPPQLTSAITNVTQVTCNGANNGSATMLLNGGTPGYNYNWSPSAQTSSMAVSLSPGTYTCFVTDANGCPASQQVTITQPNPLTISGSSVTNLTCNGNNSGQINTTITGGSPAYTINWTPVQPSNAVITNLAAGTYTLLVTDTKSCTTQGVYVVTEPSMLISSATATAATCGNANGSATVTINGGTPGYTYNWNTPSIQTASVATAMAANTWSCTITDANGCTITQSVNVPNAPGPALSSMSFTAPLCFGQQNGSMAINFSSGTAPYTFLWNNPSASTTQTVNGVGAGVYSATVTDVYGCAASGVINVTQPNILILNVSADPTICYGALTQIYAAGAGGTPAYSYTWDPSSLTGGGPHSLSPTVTTQYTVSMSDLNGCSVTPKIITINVKPQLLATGFAVTKCHGQQTNLVPTITSPGNGGPYTYNWTGGSTSSNITVAANYPTNPNTYTVNISDGCTFPGATAVFTVNVNPLPSGTFNADVTKGCAPLTVNFSANSDPSNVVTWNLEGAIPQSGSGMSVTGAFPNAGLYTISMQMVNQFGCRKDSTASSYIEVYPVPVAEFVANPWQATILEPEVKFTNLSQGAITYFWDFGDIGSSLNNTTDEHPIHVYETAGIYQVWLVAFNNSGCSDTVMHTVEILPDYALYIPNTFTPDDNGLNDVFQPKGVGIDEENYKMYIFDRWGEIIFTSEEFRKGWDGTIKGTGKQVEQGVYIYKIIVRDMKGNDHRYVGHVNCLPKQAKIE